MSNWFRYKADRPAALFVLAIFAIQLWAFFSIHDPVHLAGLIFVLMFAQVSCGAICHNHHHVQIFTRPLPNRLLEVIMYLQTGTSGLSWTIHHNIGHHGDYLDQDRDPSRWQEPDGSTMHRVKYDFYNAAMIYPEIWKIGRRFPALFARFKRWFAISNIVLLGFVLYNPLNALIVFVIPMVAMLVILLDNTYQQHSGLSTRSHLVASRNVEHPLYNLTSWNLGYHTAHHMLPGEHWSKLPALHASIRHQIPDVLVTTRIIPDLNHEIPDAP
jgi:beta-carotene hydroxylase